MKPPEPKDRETSDVGLKLYAWGALAFVITAVLVLLAVKWEFEKLKGYPFYPKESPVGAIETRLPPRPRLETNELIPFPEYLSRERQTLNSYGWINKGRGIVRVPIGRAMELYVERYGHQ